MSLSLKDLKKFIYVGQEVLDLPDFEKSANLINKVNQIVEKLVSEGKTNEILNMLVDYSKVSVENLNETANVDCLMFVLASCSSFVKEERLSHQVYETLSTIAHTPIHLFAFLYYRKYIKDSLAQSTQQQTTDKIKSKYIGKGLKKALIAWYNKQNERDLLYMLIKYKHGYTWSNKDLFKMIHMKAETAYTDYLIRYIMFGFEKLKVEQSSSNQSLHAMLNDFESLKKLNEGKQAADLIKKHAFKVDCLPSKARRFKEIWASLVEQMSLPELCESMNLLVKNEAIKANSNAEKWLLTHKLDQSNEELKRINPMHLCLAAQIFQSLNKAKQNERPSEPVSNALWSAFLQAASERKSELSNSRVMLVIEMSPAMKSSLTNGVHCLKAIQTSACILSNLYYLSGELASSNLKVFMCTDKLVELEMASDSQLSTPTLSTLDSIFQNMNACETNPSHKVFEWCAENSKAFDVFLFLQTSNANNKQILDEMNKFRAAHHSTSKLILVNLTGRRLITSESQEESELLERNFSASNFDLFLNGFTFQSNFLLHSFIKNSF